MQVLKKARKHNCVYWGAPVYTGEEKRHPMPVECKCRWDNKGYVIRLRKGGEYLSQATVLMDRVTDEDGYLWYGTLVELKGKYPKFDDPRNIPDAFIIKKTETVPTMRATTLTDMNNVAHWAYL